MRMITNLPSGQSEGHYQREDPRNPLCQTGRIRLFDNALSAVAQRLLANGARRTRDPYPPIRPTRVSRHEKNEAPQSHVHGDDIDPGGVPGVDLAGIDNRQEQRSQLPP